MNKYQFITKGAFEKSAKFEKRLNELASSGWHAVSMASDHGQITVLMERNRDSGHV